MGENEPNLLGRSIRTLAWIGDAQFERELRIRLAKRGDYPTQRLDRAKAKLASARGQARLLDAIEGALEEDERDVVQRARNTPPSGTGRARHDVKTYRAATALEALVAYWSLSGAPGQARFDVVLVSPLEDAIDHALARSEPPRRG